MRVRIDDSERYPYYTLNDYGEKWGGEKASLSMFSVLFVELVEILFGLSQEILRRSFRKAAGLPLK